MDEIFSDEDIQHIFEIAIEENNKNNPFGSFIILISNFLQVIRQNCESEDIYNIALYELQKDESYKGFLEAYQVTYKMSKNKKFIQWIKKQQITYYELEVFIFLKSLDGLLVKEMETKHWGNGGLSHNFQDFASDMNNYLKFQNRSYSDINIFSGKNDKNESKSFKNSSSLRDAIAKSFEPIKELDKVLIESGQSPIDHNYVELFEALSNIDWGNPQNSLSGSIFHLIFKELQKIHSPKRIRAAMALHELLLSLFPGQFTTMKEWENLKKESAIDNPSYKQDIEREIFKFINYRR